MVAVPNVRRRWARLRASLANIGEWKQIECLDKAGRIVTIIANENAGIAEDDDLGLESLDADSATDRAREVAPLLGLMLRAQDVALKRNHELLKSVFDSQGRLLELVSNRLANMEKQFESNLDRTQEYAQRWIDTMLELAKNEGGDGEDSDMENLIKLLPHMLRGRNGTKAAAPAAPAASSAPAG